MKKLAIKGHSTRGWEVIELLEMLGGVNGKINKKTGETYNIYNGRYFIDEICNVREVAYYIGFKSQIRCIDIKDITTNFIVYSLEMFLEKYPFKVGDKVEVCESGKVFTIGNMIWEDELCTVHYANMEDIEYYTAEELKLYKETNMKKDIKRLITIDDFNSNTKEWLINKLGDLSMNDALSSIQYLYDELHKPTYPKTYEECYNILNDLNFTEPNKYDFEFHWRCKIKDKDYGKLLLSFIKLLICRDTYWDIAGEQMGLGKPWEPNWTTFEGMPAIFRFRYNIVCDSIKNQHCLLVFPTAEMRDVFYENFKDLIESCKELL